MLSPESTRISLREVQEGTYPVVLAGGESSLDVDRKQGCSLRRFHFEGTLTRIGAEVRVHGVLSGTLNARCDRCLGDFETLLEITVDIVALLEQSGRTALPGDEAAGDTMIVTPEAPQIDLAETFRRAALLEVPIKNLCSEDCRGACASCGTNWNQETCAHAVDAGKLRRDPRWDALRDTSFSSEPEE